MAKCPKDMIRKEGNELFRRRWNDMVTAILILLMKLTRVKSTVSC